MAGLNVIPKRAFLSRVQPAGIGPRRHAGSWPAGCRHLRGQGAPPGQSFDLDFHTIPFHGEDALVEKHYVSQRSRRQKGILAFLAQDADTRVFCYADADLRKGEEADRGPGASSGSGRQDGAPAAAPGLRLQFTTYAEARALQTDWGRASSRCGAGPRPCSGRWRCSRGRRGARCTWTSPSGSTRRPR